MLCVEENANLPTGVRWGARPPLKTQNWASPALKGLRTHQWCAGVVLAPPPSPKIKAVGCAYTHPPSKKFFTQVCRNFKIFQFFYIFTNFIIQWLAIKLAVSISTIRKLAVFFLSFQIQKLLINMV